MKITLAYDRSGLEVEVPDKNLVKILAMKKIRPVKDGQAAVRQALRSPIASRPLVRIAQGKKSACVVISDYTRPVPNKEILPPLFKELAAAGIKKEDITILIATGIHAPSEGKILEEMVGKEIMRNYRLVNHFSQRENGLIDLGTTKRKTPVKINKLYFESDLKIITGLIEPHFMAGFSGGRKAICPGICSLETMRVMHGPHIMESPQATNGIIDANPFHEEALEIANMAGVDFMVNVVIDGKRKISRVFAGDLEKAHDRGMAFCGQQVIDYVKRPVDIVVTSNAGYPLDSSYYQSVKGMVTALDIVKPGGTIIMASGCAHGVGSREFKELLEGMKSTDGFIKKIKRPGFFVTDQWQVEEFCKALRKVEVLFYTTGLRKEEVKKYWATPIDSVEQGIGMALKKHGPAASIAVIPKGPYVIGRVKK